MAKYCGSVGYIETIETSPGIWEDKDIAPRQYYGDILSNVRRWGDDSKVNSDLTVNNRISILADPFAFENIQAMRWIEFMGSKWSIASVEVMYPRLIISLGGVYNA